ncbi:MAG: LamG-like jellyroll fold domain-containing protein, partial [Bdellovibrionales bacterium]
MTTALRILTISLCLLTATFAQKSLAQCTTPAGVAGEIIFSEDNNVPVYCDDTNWIAMVGADPQTSINPYIPNAISMLASEGDYLTKASDLEGVTDTKVFTMSVWFRSDNDKFHIFPGRVGASQPARIWVQASADNEIRVDGNNSAGTPLLRWDVQPSSAGINNIHDGRWYHFLVSIDLSNPANRHFYINDMAATGPVFTYIDDFFDHTEGRFDFGEPTGAYRPEADFGDFWYSTDQYVDFSIEGNRRKFIDENGYPVFLGGTGALPTGSAPDVFLSGNTDNWHTNKGTGGGFTENGTLSTATSSPGDGTRIVPNGLIGHWRLDETSGTIAVDSSGNGYDGTMNGTVTSTEGIVDTSLNFPVVTDNYIDISSANISSTNTITMTAWIKKEEMNTKQEIIFQRGTAAEGIGIENTNDLRFNWNNAPSAYNFVTGLIPPQGAWSFVALTISSTEAKVFLGVNGVLSSATRTATYVTRDINGLNIGRDPGISSRDFVGNIDDVRIYNRTLDAEEIAEIFAARDGIRYNENFRTPEFFDGNKFVSLRPEFSEPGP